MNYYNADTLPELRMSRYGLFYYVAFFQKGFVRIMTSALMRFSHSVLAVNEKNFASFFHRENNKHHHVTLMW